MSDDVARCPHGCDSTVFCRVCDSEYPELKASMADREPAAASPDDVEAIRARLAKITPGPWCVGPHIEPNVPTVRTLPGVYVAETQRHATWEHNGWADAEFIAHAPADVGALLAERDRLRKALEKQVQWIGALRADGRLEARTLDIAESAAGAALASRLPSGRPSQ